MKSQFTKPNKAIGRFAIVRLWPEINNAEVECTARIKIAAKALGIECIEIYSDGRLLDDPGKVIANKDVDFALHLHYDTPKLYDAFSFVALWNPLYFYHEWGYARTSRNLLTHDDFISCSSSGADDHLGRLIRTSSVHLPPVFNLYHSVAAIVHPPTLGDQKLFYAGINWDALRGGVSRHQELLKRLDKTGDLRIYGPSILLNINIWQGYDSYVKEIPFDGVSMIDEIARAGVALVLSSQAHKDSELMSNRLFESVAAGALIICDENMFAKRYFGDCLLYIDTRCSVDRIYSDIQDHLAWAKANPVAALTMIEKSQEIFRTKFSLIKNLSDLYGGLYDRKRELIEKQMPEGCKKIKINLFLLMPEYSDDILESHINSVAIQLYENFTPFLVIDKSLDIERKANVESAVAKSAVHIELLEICFFDIVKTSDLKVMRKLGGAVADILSINPSADAIIFVAPNEKIFSNHLQVLAGSLIRHPDCNCAASVAIVLHAGQEVKGVHEKLDFRYFDPVVPIGYSRFIFRISGLPDDLKLALPYVDRKAMAILIGDAKIGCELPSTVLLNADLDFPGGQWDEGQENEVIGSYCPAAFTVSTGNEIILPELPPPPVQPAVELPAINASDASVMPKASLVTRIRAVRRILGYIDGAFILSQMKLTCQTGLAGRFEALKRELNS